MPHLYLGVLHVGAGDLQPGRLGCSPASPIHPRQLRRSSCRLDKPGERYGIRPVWRYSLKAVTPRERVPFDRRVVGAARTCAETISQTGSSISNRRLSSLLRRSRTTTTSQRTASRSRPWLGTQEDEALKLSLVCLANFHTPREMFGDTAWSRGAPICVFDPTRQRCPLHDHRRLAATGL